MEPMVTPFKCPCGYPQYCGCPACLKNFPAPDGIKAYKMAEFIKCQGCGIVRHGCDWLDIEYEYYKKQEISLGEEDISRAGLEPAT